MEFRRCKQSAAAGFAALLVTVVVVAAVMGADRISARNRSSTEGRHLTAVDQLLFGWFGSEGSPSSAAATWRAAEQGTPSASESAGPSSGTSRISSTVTTFCAIADAPYNSREEKDLKNQLMDLPRECEFLIHLGDLKSARQACNSANFGKVVNLLEMSPAVPLVVVGDNDFTDCRNKDKALGLFRQMFVDFEKSGGWNHDLKVIRNRSRRELFYFVHKRTLFIGVNVVGGRGYRKDPQEWNTRLDDCANFAVDAMRQNILENHEADAVVLFAHAKPGRNHNAFLNPVLKFLANSLKDETPLLFLHGDGHKWNYERRWKRKDNLLRIQHKGGTREPPLIMFADSSGGRLAQDTFSFDRRLQ